MKGIILAAGQGTRLKKYTKNLPKGMLLFAGKTIIERQIELFRACGINDIVIITGFAADTITYPGVSYYHNPDFAFTNMVESMLCAKNEFTDDAIVSYSDILYSKEMLTEMINSLHDFAVAVDVDWKTYWKSRYGRIDFDTESLVLDPNGNIVSLGRENPPIDEIDARYIGLLKFTKKGLEEISRIYEGDYEEYLNKPWKQSGKHIRQAYMTDLLQALIEGGFTVSAEKFSNGWIEFDTNEDYETATKWLETGKISEFLEIK
jgi:L-glutamine-phosphate cytidylyltransferase